MGEDIGLDMSMKVTAVSVRRDGKRVCRGKCPSDLRAPAALIRKHAPAAERVVFETGPLSRSDDTHSSSVASIDTTVTTTSMPW